VHRPRKELALVLVKLHAEAVLVAFRARLLLLEL
jgi:hypothetical protein